MLSTLVGGRVSIAAAATTSAKVGLSIAVRYADKRKQFGAGTEEQAILDYTSHLRRLMPRLARTYACHAAVRALQARYLGRTEEDAREVESLAAGIKAYATWHNTDTLQECRECCGGAGYLADNRVGPLADDTDVFTTFEGDNTVLMLLVAKSLLGEFKAQFHDSRTFAVLRLIAKRALAEIVEKNPVATRRTSVEHLDDRDFQLDALRFRETALVRSVAMRMKKRIDAGMGAFEAQNEVQPHLLATSRAHVERVLLEELYRSVQDSGLDGETRDAVKRVVDLFALSCIEDDAAWFLEQDYIESSKFRAIRKRVTSLCRELRPHARALVDAFAVPDACIGAPIATRVVPPAQRDRSSR